jgi:hypothetical protein
MQASILTRIVTTMLMCVLVFPVLLSHAEGQTADFISYQGRLTDSDGIPLNGTYSIVFSMWDDSTSGIQLWTETLSVDVADGLFAVDLGRINALTVDICGAVDPWFIPHLQIEVAGEVIEPRTPLGRVASSFHTQRVFGDITTAPGEVMVSDKVKITTSPTSAEVLLKSGNGDEALGLTADGWAGIRIPMIGSAGDTVAQYNPDGILFNTVGPPELPTAAFDPIMGIMFADETTGDTTAQYGPGEAVMVQLQPEPPGPSLFTRMEPASLVMGIDPWFDKIMTEVCNAGIILTDSETGDTVAQYGPGEAVMVQLQPEPPGPSLFTRMGPASLVMGIDPLFDKRMTEVCNSGIVLTDSTTGDTIAQYGPGRVVLTDLEADTARLEFSELLFVNIESAGTARAEYGPSDLLFAWQPESRLPADTTQLGIDRLQFQRFDGQDTIRAEYGLYGSMLELLNTAPGERVESPRFPSYLAFYCEGHLGWSDTTKLSPTGLVFKDEDPALTEYSAVGVTMVGTMGDTTVKISNQGSMNLALNAGETQAIEAGDRYRDNSIVAWARVNGSATSWDEYGVTSLSRVTTGMYSIVIDANLTSSDLLIPMVVAEVDTQPTNASSARIVSVNQTTSVNTFEVFINDGDFTPVDNEFVFMVTGR